MAKSIDARVNILADTADLERGMRRSIAATDKFNKSTKRISRNPFRSVTRSVAGLAGAYIGAQGLITVIQGAVREQQESVKVGRQTNAVLKSTKSAAGLSAKAIGDLAQALSEKTAVDDEAIQSAENLLLTFTKIGKDTFPAATAAVLDLSAATGTSLKGASIQVGKALQDPVRGLTALRKVGVNFSADQTEVIKKLVDTGKTADAQKLILKELATEFGGSAAAQATPLDRLRVTYQNLLETIGGYLVPVLNDVATATIKFVEQFRAGVGAGGQFRDTLKGIYDTLRPIVAFLINHPAVVAGAAAAYIAFKATLAALNLFSTLMTAYGTLAQYTAAGSLRGAAFARGLALGLVVGLPVALLGVADIISQALLPKNMPAQMESAFGFTGSIQERFAKWWANLKKLASSGYKFLRNGAIALGAVFFSNVRDSIVQSLGAVSSAFRRMKSVASSVFGYVGGIAKKVGSAIRSAFDFAKAGVDALVNAISRLGSAIGNLPGLDTLKKIKAVVGRTPERLNVDAQNVLLNQGAGTSAGALRDQQALLAAQAKVAAAKTKKAREKAANELAALERRQAAKQARASAGETLKGFIEGIRDTIRTAELDRIMAPVNAARAARAARETGVARGGLGSAISRAQAEAADPRVRARYARDAARLDARIAQARKQGNLEALDALQNEKDALDARYGPAYLAELQDQLAQLNENEIEASSEAAATAFAATFATGMQAALDGLLNGGTVAAFFAKLTTALQGSGVSPGALPASVTAGAGEAAAALAPPPASLGSRITAYLRGKDKKKTYTASQIAAGVKPKSTKSAVFGLTGKEYGGYKIANRASGGMLTPGMLTMVGETGPELIMGGKVMSSTRTNRMGGGQGMNITVNAVGAAADDPMLLARQLGWQLATR